MKHIIMCLFLLVFSGSVFAAGECIHPGDPAYNNRFPIQVDNWGWSGSITANPSTGKASVYNEDGSILGTYNIAYWDNNISCTQALYKVLGVGDGNTWVRVTKLNGYNKYINEVLWYGVIYVRQKI